MSTNAASPPDDHAPRGESNANFTTLLSRAAELATPGNRYLLGITGAPAAGKSTFAEQLVAALHPHAVLVPMDGFHLADAELKRLGIHERKGAPDTFDVAGFVALLRRLRAADEDLVYAPTFRRDLEEPIAGAIGVSSTVPLVVTEGNYLLTEIGGWAGVRPLLDEVWYLDPEETVRIDRLVERHMHFGRDRIIAEARARGTDQRNAELIESTRAKADLIIAGDWRGEGNC